MPLSFILSQKERKQLLLHGFLFSRKTINKDSVTWRCVDYYKEKCKAIVRTDTEIRTGLFINLIIFLYFYFFLFSLFIIYVCYVGYVIGEIPNHDHAGDASSIAAKKLKNKIIKRGAKNNDPPSLVVGDALAKASSPAVARLPKIESMARSIQRVRKPDKVVEPSSYEKLIIPDELCVTAKGDNV